MGSTNEYAKFYQRLHSGTNRINASRIKERKILLKSLGNKCVNCGFSDIRALQIDHKNGDGSADKKRFKKQTGTMVTYYSRNVKEATQKLQILCANCNWIKRAENKEYGGGKKLEICKHFLDKNKKNICILEKNHPQNHAYRYIGRMTIQ